MDQQKLSSWKMEIESLIEETFSEVPDSALFEESKGRRLEHWMRSLESLMRIERMVKENE